MNAQRIWRHLCQSYNEQDWKTVRQLSEDLIDWLQQGGNPPRVVSQLPNTFSHKVVALAVCRNMRREAKRQLKEV